MDDGLHVAGCVYVAPPLGFLQVAISDITLLKLDYFVDLIAVASDILVSSPWLDQKLLLLQTEFTHSNPRLHSVLDTMGRMRGHK